jgi:hypothetical protein
MFHQAKSLLWCLFFVDLNVVPGTRADSLLKKILSEDALRDKFLGTTEDPPAREGEEELGYPFTAQLRWMRYFMLIPTK